jgi:hypothetical protein
MGMPYFAVLASILFILSMTLIPVLERLFFRDPIRRSERGGRSRRYGRRSVT